MPANAAGILTIIMWFSTALILAQVGNGIPTRMAVLDILVGA